MSPKHRTVGEVSHLVLHPRMPGLITLACVNVCLCTFHADSLSTCGPQLPACFGSSKETEITIPSISHHQINSPLSLIWNHLLDKLSSSPPHCGKKKKRSQTQKQDEWQLQMHFERIKTLFFLTKQCKPGQGKVRYTATESNCP